MELGDREEKKDNENLEVHLNTLISGRPRLSELDVNVSTEGVKQQENVGKTKQGMWKRRGQ